MCVFSYFVQLGFGEINREDVQLILVIGGSTVVLHLTADPKFKGLKTAATWQ
jgi:hypothetical protein